MRARTTIYSMISALGAAALCSCASEDSAGRFLVEPDKYVLYNCVEIAAVMQVNVNRQHELEALMAKAEAGSGGQLVSDLAYRPEYIQLRGEMNELRKTNASKNCKPVPEPLVGRTSDRVVR